MSPKLEDSVEETKASQSPDLSYERTSSALGMPTILLHPPREPMKPHSHDHDVDEAEVRDDGGDVDVDLLVRPEGHHVDTARKTSGKPVKF